MNGILWTAVILLAVTAGILSAFLHGYRRQVRALKRQMDFLKQTDTSLQLSTTLTFRDVDALAVDINEALDRHRRTEQALLRVSRNYKDTITSISHDLRTPLTSASGYLQMLRSPKIPAKKREQYLRVIDRRIGSVQKLLDQLFEFARIEADELVLESKRLPVNNVLRDAVSLSTTISARRARVQVWIFRTVHRSFLQTRTLFAGSLRISCKMLWSTEMGNTAFALSKPHPAAVSALKTLPTPSKRRTFLISSTGFTPPIAPEAVGPPGWACPSQRS